MCLEERLDGNAVVPAGLCVHNRLPSLPRVPQGPGDNCRGVREQCRERAGVAVRPVRGGQQPVPRAQTKCHQSPATSSSMATWRDKAAAALDLPPDALLAEAELSHMPTKRWPTARPTEEMVEADNVVMKMFRKTVQWVPRAKAMLYCNVALLPRMFFNSLPCAFMMGSMHARKTLHCISFFGSANKFAAKISVLLYDLREASSPPSTFDRRTALRLARTQRDKHRTPHLRTHLAEIRSGIRCG